VAGDLIYAFRVTRLPLLDVDGETIGRIEDIVLSPARQPEPPRVLGFVAQSQRRHIFVNAARVGTLDGSGARLRSGTIDLDHFEKRPGELLAKSDLLDRRVGDEIVNDLALRPDPDRSSSWSVAAVALARVAPLRRRRTVRVVDWTEVASLFDAGPVGAEVARLRDMHPSDVAEAIRALPLTRRRQLA